MTNNAVIVSGSSGFIGKHFINKYPNTDLYRTLRNDNSIFFEKINSKTNSEYPETDKEIVLLHLATYFSKDPDDSDLIYKANVDFGKELLGKLKYSKVKKIIYTNTMFNFYKEKNIRELHYTKSKQLFSDYLKNYCSEEKILYEEIYLDNTFGKEDNRDKIIPNIIKSIQQGKKNPIKNSSALINLVSVEDVVRRLFKAVSEKRNISSIFVQEKSFELNSIYDYLAFYKQTNVADESIIKLKNNNYLNSLKIFNENDLKLNRVNEQLLELIK
tara:strand:- start:38835 stop:39650 length:816 start_codon:yes stop_codon:yes gene_type:complete